MEGNVFWVFTPVEWDSPEFDEAVTVALGKSNCLKSDPSLKSYVASHMKIFSLIC
jgi:hypothetical protein